MISDLSVVQSFLNQFLFASFVILSSFIPRFHPNRCPLILNLKHDPSVHKGEFKFSGEDKIFTSPGQVTAKINAMTEDIAKG